MESSRENPTDGTPTPATGDAGAMLRTRQLADLQITITAAHEAEEAYRSLAENSLQALALFQNDRVVFANRAFAQLTGFPLEKLTGMAAEGIFALVHPDDREKVRANYRSRLDGGPAPSRYELRIIGSDLVERWIENCASGIQYRGRPAVQLACLDITERKNAALCIEQAHAELERKVAVRTAELTETNRTLVAEIERRRSAEERTAEQERFFGTLIQNAQDGITVLDSEGRFEYGNDAFFRIVGWPASELLGKNFMVLVPPDFRPFMVSRWEEMKGGRPQPYEVDIVGKDGGRRTLMVSRARLETPTGWKSCASVRDITARKLAEHELERHRAQLEEMIAARTAELTHANAQLQQEIEQRTQVEEALRESEESFRALAENAGEGVIIATEGGRHAYANGLMCSLSGYSMQEILGIGVGDLIAPEERERVKAITSERMIGGDAPRQYETVLLHKDGRRISVEIAGARTVWRGAPATIGMMRDITERKAVQALLERSRQQLARAQALANVGSWYHDLSSGRLEISEQLCRIYGIEPAQYDCKVATLHALIHPDDRPRLRQAAERAGHGQIESQEFRILRPDGSLRFVFYAGETVRDEAGRTVGTLGAVMDITERRCMEQEILEVSNAERRQIGQTLHDSLGQQLAGIAFLIGAAEADQKAGRRPSLAGLRRLAKLVNEAVIQTRAIAQGLSPVALADDGLPTALRQLTAGVRAVYGISCRFICREPVPLLSQEAAAHLYCIAQEATTNALRHGKAGRVAVRLSVVRKRGRLAISDNGVGLPGLSDRQPGLGLRIMRYRAEMIGGRLTIASEPGLGTKVICEFPVFKPARP